MELVELDYQGVFNCVSEGVASRHEYVSEIYKILNLMLKFYREIKHLKDVDVSNNESAVNFKLKALNLIKVENGKKDYKNILSKINQIYKQV